MNSLLCSDLLKCQIDHITLPLKMLQVSCQLHLEQKLSSRSHPAWPRPPSTPPQLSPCLPHSSYRAVFLCVQHSKLMPYNWLLNIPDTKLAPSHHVESTHKLSPHQDLPRWMILFVCLFVCLFYSRSLLVIYFKYSSVYMSIPNSQSIPPPYPFPPGNHKFIL